MMAVVRPSAVVAVILLAGCSRSQAYLEVFRDQHAAWEEAARILASIKDGASMEAARDQLAEHMVRCQAIAQRAKSLPPPSAETLEQLESERDRMNRALQKMRAEIERVRQLSGGPEFLKDIDHIVRGSQ